MRVLFISSTEKGHLNPMVGVAQHLLRGGQEAGWITVPHPAPQLARLGVEVVALEWRPAPHGLPMDGEALARMAHDPAAMRAWIRGLLIAGVDELVPPMRRAIRSFAPDVIALDGMQYAGVIAAHQEKVPYVGLSTALTLLEPPLPNWTLIESIRALSNERRALFARYGLAPEFRTCECLSPWRNVIFATRALVGEDVALPPHTELVGPSRPIGARGDEIDFPWERLDGRPLIYVSFGSQLAHQPDLFRLIVEAAHDLGTQLVLSAGDLACSNFARDLPARVIAVPYAPQLALLARARAFVSHGGANSLMEAMTAGVPMLILPICNDQPVQAHFLTRAGAGLALAARAHDAASVRRALASLLEEQGAYRRAAQHVSVSYRASDGARVAAARILQVAAAGVDTLS